MSNQSHLDSIENHHDACGVGFVYTPERKRATIDDALNALIHMEHRGATGADGVTGDGAGILTTIPREILRKEGISIHEHDALAVLFIPAQLSKKRNTELTAVHRDYIHKFLKSRGFTARAWRKVPVRHQALGAVALSTCPLIEQLVISYDGNLPEEELDRLYSNLRVSLSQFMRFDVGEKDFYIPSLSRKTVVYKAMTTSQGLVDFYDDLRNRDFKAQWAVFHRRFSTNTVSRWPLAQPFRLLAHNGEINTLKGNLNWMHARLSQSALDVAATWDDTRNELAPGSKVDYAGSDSSVLDFCVETLVNEADGIESAFMKLIPEAHEHHSQLKGEPEIQHFYEFFAPHQEPWDGPAMVAFSDATTIGAVLDRNGLRPARFTIYDDGSVLLASEAGLRISTDSPIAKLGRLGPGQMLTVDIKTGNIRHDIEVKTEVAKKHPYGQWLLKERRALEQREFSKEWTYSSEELLSRQIAAGYTKEDLDAVITYMAINDSEPVLSMGDDTPPAVLSLKPKKLTDYFRQRFAQVTNPPIDPIRERLVMSLTSYLGRRSVTLRPTAELARTIIIPSPIINDGELAFLESLCGEYKSTRISTLFDENETLEEAIERIGKEALEKAADDNLIIVLSDRNTDKQHASIPMIAAVGAVHHRLIRAGLRLKCSLLAETSQCWTSHQAALLISYGAQCILPYLAFESIRHWYWSDETQKRIHDDAPGNEKYRELDVYRCQSNFRSALEAGLLKIISKMGISKLTSYVGAQIFECLGLGEEIMERCFAGTNSPIGGLTFADLEKEVATLHQRGFEQQAKLVDEGVFKSKRAGGEYHRNNAELVKALHSAIDLKQSGASDSDKQKQFRNYASLVAKQPPSALRDLLTLRSHRQPIELHEVESVQSIVEKFLTGGMSLGALSKESHETLAIAMNRLKARSNSGEGGEDPKRYKPIRVNQDGTSDDFPGLKGLRQGDSAASRIRQIASGRFGVTPAYLVTAEQLEIKIAQGAKPGEGGQLPADKVSDYIAHLRRTDKGITLISPPPHHDIYSIEDLAQLVYDLKQVNPRAKVSIKLVSEQGIGPVALGCTKAGADIVHVAGHDGGTGAAPAGSIKHAGLPWELGLSETHRFLSEHRLRNRVVVRVDGGLRSGVDVVKAAIIGADEFAFGTIALIAQGCIMARVCHTNNCPAGIATQKEALREKFHGTPDSVVEFFLCVAEEVRHLLADLGFKSLFEIRGRTDLLHRVENTQEGKCGDLILDEILERAPFNAFDVDEPVDTDQLSGLTTVDPTSCGLNELLAHDPAIINAVETQSSVMKGYHIKNTDRTVGAMLSGLIATIHGDTGFSGQIVLNFEGSAGQSFAAFNARNVLMYLKGEANDYVAKGMFGGEVVIRPQVATVDTPVLAGNTCLYGATGGKLLVAGLAGERFAVRNSGAQAVVEGIGDHGLEYMTGGVVVVLGKTGRNFGAGMSGGLAFVFDEDGSFADNVNCDCDKQIYRLTPASESLLVALIEEHYRLTASAKARHLLDNWEDSKEKFVQLVPPRERERAGLCVTEDVDQTDERMYA